MTAAVRKATRQFLYEITHPFLRPIINRSARQTYALSALNPHLEQQQQRPFAASRRTFSSLTDAKDTDSCSRLNMRPAEFVRHLDRFIIGQSDAKRAVAVAFRSRWRESQLPEDIRADICSRNILMIGPTGCGKTEIARQVAKITGCPLIRTEATKFTELGFVGANIDDIISDLVEASLVMVRGRMDKALRGEARHAVEEKLLKLLAVDSSSSSKTDTEKLREKLRSGELDDESVDLGSLGLGHSPLSDANGTFAVIDPNKGLMANFRVSSVSEPRFDDRRQRVSVSEARARLEEAEIEELSNQKELSKEAVKLAEESGVVFLDEIDKICTRRSYYNDNRDASAEGVQRDLLPLIEGTTVKTKHGDVKTDKVLFICAGAFHNCDVSDLLPELQGRLPIRVELSPLTEDDLYMVLKDTESNWLKQEIELLGTEGVELEFEDESLRVMANIAAHANRVIENIGARRLHTVVERVVSELSYEVPGLMANEISELSDGLAVEYKHKRKRREKEKDKEKPVIVITPEYVHKRLDGLTSSTDLDKYVI